MPLLFFFAKQTALFIEAMSMLLGRRLLMFETLAAILTVLLGLGLAGILLLVGALVVLLLIIRELIALVRFMFKSSAKKNKKEVDSNE